MYDALELWPRFFARIFTSETQDTAQDIALALPIATEILALEKPRNLVFRHNGGENYFRFRFSLHIPILHGRLSRNRHKTRNRALTLFREN